MSQSAFPIQFDDRPGAYEADPGMSLRDYFAGQSIGAVVAACAKDTLINGESREQMFARRAYAIADAMMTAREVKA